MQHYQHYCTRQQWHGIKVRVDFLNTFLLFHGEGGVTSSRVDSVAAEEEHSRSFNKEERNCVTSPGLFQVLNHQVD